ncbi:hypothetical protein [Photobacterium damselae]|uniref:hypothetical protein n=1 Tax=Photobacterium damselae TaxID=38293 RepID=UPI002542E681
MKKTELNLSSIGIVKFFIGIIFILFLLNDFAIYIQYFTDWKYVNTFIRLVNVDLEMNVPTLYSSCSMIFASILLAITAALEKKQGCAYLAWYGLSFIFFFLALDEATELHEMLVTPLRATLNTSGAFYFAWVIPYAMLVVLFLLCYIRFLIRLPNRFTALFIISGFVYVAGALIFELIGGEIASIYGVDTLIYAVSYTIEEFLEMLGIVLLIYTVSSYIKFKNKSITLNWI